ncbi:MAG: dolichyl-phosphate beta-glucosyltransferase [Bacteroidota bacterium]
MQSNKVSISLVIPCYNESNRLSYLEAGLREFRDQWQYSYEVIIVDDGSKDDTAQLLQEKFLPLSDNKVEYKIIPLSQNQGKGGALQAGVRAAKGAFVLTLDADMAARPTELNKWLKQLPLTQFSPKEILIGSRNHPESQIDARQDRKFAGQVFNTLVRIVTPIKNSDTQCGFKLYPTPIAQLLFQDLQIKGWAHDIELLYKANYLKIPVKSMPLQWQHIDDEKIDVLADGVKMAWETVKLSFRFRMVKEYRSILKACRKRYQQMSW